MSSNRPMASRVLSMIVVSDARPPRPAPATKPAPNVRKRPLTRPRDDSTPTSDFAIRPLNCSTVAALRLNPAANCAAFVFRSMLIEPTVATILMHCPGYDPHHGMLVLKGLARFVFFEDGVLGLRQVPGWHPVVVGCPKCDA